MLDAALAYAGMGWQVFPCRPKAKAPLTPHGCKDATTDPETIRAWFVRWPDANIALACGPESGVYVVDIDLDTEHGVNGWDSLKAFPGFPPTVMQRSPRGGAHYFFASSNPPRNKNSFRPGIDIRSTGYYVMLTPSVHPNEKTYEWEPGKSPFDCRLAEFPASMRPEAENVAPWERRPAAAVKPPACPASTPVVERARAYLLECEPARQGQAGHEKLLWAARALVVGFELPESTATYLLWADFNQRCVPPWDASKPADVKDFERKVAEVAKTPGSKPRGWLLDELGMRGDDALLAYGSLLRDDLLASAADMERDEARPEIIRPRKKEKVIPVIPEELLHPPGMVGQIADWITSTAICPQPLLSVGCSLTACGALFGQKVRDESNGRTNLYMMGVAASSAGKDHPSKCIRTLFAHAGASAILGGSRVTSDTALEMALMSNPIQLFTWDEMGHFLSSIKQAGAGSGGAQHLRTIVPALMELYSSAGDMYIGKQKADGEIRRIEQPHVCVWGLTSPDVLFEGLSTRELRDGWLGRVITLISHDRPKPNPLKAVPAPEAIVQMTQAWIQRVVPPPEGVGNILGATTCFQHTTVTQPGAYQIFSEFNDRCYARMLDCDKNSDDVQFLWGKAFQNARRIALIVANGTQFDGAEITPQHAKFGCDFIEWNITQFAEEIRDNLADNAWESDKHKILKLLEKRGSAGMSKSDLTRLTPQLRDKRTRDAYIDDLREGGQVVVGMNPLYPEARAGWLWKTPFGLDIVCGWKAE